MKYKYGNTGLKTSIRRIRQDPTFKNIADKDHASKQWSLVVGLVSVGLLMVTWPVPHTISVRYLLVVFSLGWLGALAVRDPWVVSWQKAFGPPTALLTIFVLWMLLLALYGPMDPGWSLGEIRGQWVTAIFAAAIALFVVQASIARGMKFETTFTVVALLPLFFHVLVIDLSGLLPVWSGGDLAERVAGLTSGPDTSSYLTNMSVALLLAEVLARSCHGRRIMPVGNTALIVLVAPALLSIVVGSTRNGIAVISVVGGIWAGMLFRGLYRVGKVGKIGAWTGVGVTILAVLISLAVASTGKPGISWRQVAAAVPIALDTEHNRQWLDMSETPEVPKLPDGTEVDGSAYMRLAWFKEGLILIEEHPLGVGFGRQVFGHRIAQKYGVEFRGHAHSSIIDLGIGTGFPGLFLWVGFLISLAAIAWRADRRYHDGFAAALFFVVLDFGLRSVVDSNVRDHMLQQFLFISTLLLLMTAHRPTLDSSSAAPARR